VADYTTRGSRLALRIMAEKAGRADEFQVEVNIMVDAGGWPLAEAAASHGSLYARQCVALLDAYDAAEARADAAEAEAARMFDVLTEHWHDTEGGESLAAYCEMSDAAAGAWAAGTRGAHVYNEMRAKLGAAEAEVARLREWAKDAANFLFGLAVQSGAVFFGPSERGQELMRLLDAALPLAAAAEAEPAATGEDG
jgi:hypothetical protein